MGSAGGPLQPAPASAADAAISFRKRRRDGSSWAIGMMGWSLVVIGDKSNNW
jgi:hypothetical protein